MGLVEWIAAEPHPTGSAANQKVRDALVGALQGLSLEPEVRSESILVPWRGEIVRGGRVDNILARVPGTDSTGTVLLAAHYDSVPTGPGAGDDAAGVAAMLEVARLLTEQPVRNDVLLLLTDGEELGLLGARAFVRDEALLGEIEAAANFEARGGGGPSLLFETSDNNAWLIDAFSTAPHPSGNSLAYEVYQRMPNDTDFSVFRRAGLDGLNFGFIDWFTSYHSAIDTPELLDPRSLQHHGEGMLALARALGERDFSEEKPSGNAVFFNLPGFMIRYPAGLALPLALLGALITAGRIRRSTIGGAVTAVVSVAACGAVGLGIAMLLERFHPGMSAIRHPTLYDDIPWRVVVAAASLLTVFGLRAALSRFSDVEGMWSGGRLVWALLAVGCAIEAPGASYLFTWPLLAAAVAPKRWGGVAGAVAIFFGVQTADQLLIALGVVGSPVAGVLYGLTGLLLVTERPRILAAGAASGLLLSGALGLLPSTPDESEPRHESLAYLQDDDGASWIADRRASWNEEYLSGAVQKFESGERSVMFRGQFYEAPTESVGLRKPILRTRSTITAADRHWNRGTLYGKRGGCAMMLRIEDTGRLSSLKLDGEEVVLSGGPLSLVYFASLQEGVDIDAEVLGQEPLPVKLSEITFGLPEAIKRSEGSVPVPWGFGITDSLTVTTTIEL